MVHHSSFPLSPLLLSLSSACLLTAVHGELQEVRAREASYRAQLTRVLEGAADPPVTLYIYIYHLILVYCCLLLINRNRCPCPHVFTTPVICSNLLSISL